ncbi:molybdopterin molybdotransferase MoeA [Sulfurimonas sp. SAG-AH-194-L11]|nr:molybdopterin molybdotransferase MoeA [Sulfurimonas sp. SAG-AH-194-L11]MDF1877466.1 molybdopterin molybdotransferase MoeA [Sulfurimonas sp. SAG-AH-194-L11]
MAISVEKALELIYTNVKKTSLQILPIEQCLGYILAQNVIATHNLPPFDNSAMDGYAVKVEDSGKSVKVETTIFAGDNFDGVLRAGCAIKIMTGAKIPLGTQCIVPIEDILETTQDGVTLPHNLTISRHIRLAGEDIKKETPLLHAGDTINAHQITLLASQGISHIKVHKAPRVALFASGNELKMHFEQVTSYQLYNTNTPTLLARAEELGCEVEFIGTAQDTLEDLILHIKSALECDLVITSGGVSVGDADFTKEAFGAFGYTIFFDKIDIKPGKPTTFGKIGETLILNLPGNPLAAALNFEIFGTSIIRALSGATSKFTNPIKAKMKSDYGVRGGRRSLIPGVFDGEFFTPCEHFAPGMVSPLGYANSYIMIDESCKSLAQESDVKVISTKFNFTSAEYKSLVSL